MSANSFSSEDDDFGTDIALKHPPTILLVTGLISVLSGTLIGVYGFITRNSATTVSQYFLGAAGYLLTIAIPIAFLQLLRMRHDTAVKQNLDQPYDIYAGQQLQSRFLKVVALGFAGAFFSITVFFWPIAQGLA